MLTPSIGFAEYVVIDCVGYGGHNIEIANGVFQEYFLAMNNCCFGDQVGVSNCLAEAGC